MIEIDPDGTVRTIERRIIATTTLDAAAPHLEIHAPTIMPPLPRGTFTAAFDEDAQRGSMLIERQPSRESLSVHFDVGMREATPHIDFDRAGDNRRVVDFNIQLPYLYFLYGFKLGTRPADMGVTMADFTIDRSNLYMSRDPLRTLDDKLWKATMMNVRDAKICWGSTMHDHDTLANRLNHMVTEFPVTTFNNHYGIPLPRGVNSLTEWEARSEGNPLFHREWAHWETPPDSRSVADLLKMAMSDGRAARDYTGLPAVGILGDVLIPEPPMQFTMGRMRQWINELPRPLKRRFLAEAARVAAEGDPEGDAYAEWLETMRNAGAERAAVEQAALDILGDPEGEDEDAFFEDEEDMG
jgi:hypothetical protein